MLETIFGGDKFYRIVLDIFLLSSIFYFLYRLFKTVKMPLLFNQIGLLLIFYVVASLLGLETVLWILKSVFGWIVIALIIIFHPELRALVMHTDYAQLFRREKKTLAVPDFQIITQAIEFLISVKRGALFIFPREIELDHIILSKVEINADLSSELIETIFSHNTVLHDGALIINKNKIVQAGCFLPIERSNTVLYGLGSRHRAALGLSQNSDAVVLVLSEEYGSVSLVFDGEILYDIGIEKCCIYIEQLLIEGKIDTIVSQVNHLKLNQKYSIDKEISNE